MTKKLNVLRIGFISGGVLLALFIVSPVATQKAHAALVLDPVATTMLSDTLSVTRNLMGTVQFDINTGAFTPYQSTVISATIGGIGSILANISNMIGGIGFPDAGYSPLDSAN